MQSEIVREPALLCFGVFSDVHCLHTHIQIQVTNIYLQSHPRVESWADTIGSILGVVDSLSADNARKRW